MPENFNSNPLFDHIDGSQFFLFFFHVAASGTAKYPAIVITAPDSSQLSLQIENYPLSMMKALIVCCLVAACQQLHCTSGSPVDLEKRALDIGLLDAIDKILHGGKQKKSAWRVVSNDLETIAYS